MKHTEKFTNNREEQSHNNRKYITDIIYSLLRKHRCRMIIRIFRSPIVRVNI